MEPSRMGDVAVLDDAYGRAVDLAVLRELIDRDDDSAWEWIWGNLVHQGSIGSAAYPFANELVNLYSTRPRRWEFYAFLCHIELWRSPDLLPPTEWRSVFARAETLALKDFPTVPAGGRMVEPILGVLALSRSLTSVGWYCVEMTDDERSEVRENVSTPLAVTATELMRARRAIDLVCRDDDSGLRRRERRGLEGVSALLSRLAKARHSK